MEYPQCVNLIARWNGLSVEEAHEIVALIQRATGSDSRHRPSSLSWIVREDHGNYQMHMGRKKVM
jgi:hypothetical protein